MKNTSFIPLLLAIATLSINPIAQSADQFARDHSDQEDAWPNENNNNFPEDGDAIIMEPLDKRSKISLFERVPFRGRVPAGTRDISSGIIEVTRATANRAPGLKAIIEGSENNPAFNRYTAIDLPYSITILRVLIGLLRYFDNIAPTFRKTYLEGFRKVVLQEKLDALEATLQQVITSLSLTKEDLIEILAGAMELQFPDLIIEALENIIKRMK